MPIKCRACGVSRQPDKIAVRKLDRSAELNLPAGTYGNNFQYCNDNVKCADAALAFRGYT